MSVKDVILLMLVVSSLAAGLSGNYLQAIWHLLFAILFILWGGEIGKR